MEEAKEVEAGKFVLTVSEGSGDLPEYKILPAEEPYKAYISAIYETKGTNFDGDPVDQLRFAFKLTEGEGEGQIYSMWVNAPTSNFIHPKSGIYAKILSKVYKDIPEGLDLDKLKGQPCRIELSEAYASRTSGKQIQKITLVKGPAADQKPVKVSQQKKDNVPTELSEDIDAELTKVFGPTISA